MDSPIIHATWQAAVLSALSNLLAQSINCWRTQTAWRINTTDLFQFILFSILASPPNYIWQSWLEAQYPAYTEKLSPSEKEALVDRSVAGEKLTSSHDRVESKAAVTDKSKGPHENHLSTLNKKNTAMKFALDQTFGAVFNTVLFIAGIGLIRGQSMASIQHDLISQFPSMILAGAKLWPLVSILCFTLIPLEYRMLVGNTAGLFWGIYLSLMAGSGT